MPGCGLPEALATGVECGHQRWNDSRAAENEPVGTWPPIPTGWKFMNRLRKNTLRWIIPAFLLAGHAAAQSSYDLKSPDGRIEVRLRTANRTRYDVLLKGAALVEDSTLSLDVDHKKLGLEPKVAAAKESSHNGVIEPQVHQKFDKIRESYNELRLRPRRDIFESGPDG